MMKINCFMILVMFTAPLPLSAQVPVGTNNSNYWPVHRDIQSGFRISYPTSWIVAQPKGVNVKFSVNPPDGPGNCNVVAKQKPEINNINQPTLNQEIESLPQTQVDWAGYIGLQKSQVNLVQSRVAKIVDVPALMGVVETSIDNMEGKYLRKQLVALTFKPGILWTLNCGVSSFNFDEARERFDKLEPVFNKIFGSFTFLP